VVADHLLEELPAPAWGIEDLGPADLHLEQREPIGEA
jgi:hypothetical protein